MEWARHERRCRCLPPCWKFPDASASLKPCVSSPFRQVFLSSQRWWNKTFQGWLEHREVLADFAVCWHRRVQFSIVIDTYSHAAWTCNWWLFLEIICHTEGKQRTSNHRSFDNTNASISWNSNPLSIFLTPFSYFCYELPGCRQPLWPWTQNKGIMPKCSQVTGGSGCLRYGSRDRLGWIIRTDASEVTALFWNPRP